MITMTDSASDESPARPTVPNEITELRGHIDALDTQIAELVAERMQVSRQIQAARISAGGTRLELGRERVVLDGYRRILGADGPLLGEVVLRVCRGRR